VTGVKPRLAVGTVSIYDPASDTFSSGASLPLGRERGAAGAVARRGKIYLLGGYRDTSSVAFVDVYDPGADEWTSLPDMPRARDHFQPVVVDGILYAIGGRDGLEEGSIPDNDAFDFRTRTWATGLAPLPTLRSGAAAAPLGQEILVMGGEHTDESGYAIFDTVEAYDTTTDTWRTLTPMPRPRHGTQAVAYRRAVYVVVGGTAKGMRAPTDSADVFFPVSGLPDAMIRLRGDVAWVGGDVYDATGASQVREVGGQPGERVRFSLRFQNDADVTGPISIDGCRRSPGFSIRYFNGVGGAVEVTEAVVDGEFSTGDLAPGRSARLILRIRFRAPAGSSETCRVVGTAVAPSAVQDGVRARVEVV